MRDQRLLILGFLAAGAALNAQSHTAVSPAESKISRLEIRRVGKHPRDAAGACRSLRRTEQGFCSVQRFGAMLEFAFNTSQLRIVGPQWMAADDFYLLHFAYDVDGRCPAIVRSLAREILTEKLSLAVHRELREASVLVMRASDHGALAHRSGADSCETRTANPDDEWLPARKAGLPWGLRAVMEMEATRPSYLGRTPLEEPRMYRGCTLTELARLLERGLYTEVLDESGDPDRYDFTLDSRTFRPSGVTPEQVAQQLNEQLGLDARVEKRQIEHLVVEGQPPPERIEYRANGPVPPAPCPAL